MHSLKEVAEQYAGVALSKTQARPLSCLAKAVLAGMFIALAAMGAVSVSALGLGAGAAKIIGALVFPVGLAMVLLTGAELFTGNNLLLLAVCDGCITVRQLLLNWALVYLGNFLGALIIAGLSAGSRALDASFVAASVQAAQAKMAYGPLGAFLRGVLCNILVCAAVWMSYAADGAEGKIIAMFMPVMMVVLLSTEHCVANLYYFPAALLMGGRGLSLRGFLLGNLLPVTLGNIVGGAGLFGGLVWLAGFAGRK